MLRRSPLRRRTPLLARLRPAVTTGVRAALVDRSAGVCEMALPGCTTWATDAAHRVSRKAGGRRGAAKTHADALSNVLHACRVCHAWCHARPVEAYELGMALREWHNPLAEPVMYRGRLSYLSDDGMVHNYEEATDGAT
jgi:hypothetical protein